MDAGSESRGCSYLVRAASLFAQRQEQQAGHARKGSGNCRPDCDVIPAKRATWEHGMDETTSEYAERGEEARTDARIIAGPLPTHRPAWASLSNPCKSLVSAER